MTTAPALSAALDRTLLASLLEPAEPPCISLYLPTHGPHTEAVQDPIRLRNLLREAKTALSARGLSDDTASAMLAQAEALADDRGFWPTKTPGLALFGCNGDWRTLRLPMSVEAEVVVGDVVSLRQLAGLFEPSGHCMALVVDQRRARLFEVDRWSLQEVDLPEITPSTPDNGSRSDVQLRRAAAGPSDAAFFHGHGGAKDIADDQRDRFLREVERAVQPILAKRALPVVLAGDTAVTAALRPMLHTGEILGTVSARPDRVDLSALHDDVWAVAQPAVDRARDRATEQYANLSGTGRTARGAAEVAQAAASGRIEVLLLPPSHLVAATSDAPLVDQTVLDTLRMSGDVVQLPRDTTDDQPAAILRH